MGAVRTALHDQPLDARRPPPRQPAPRVLRSPPRPRRRNHPRHRPLPRRDGTSVGVRPSGSDTMAQLVQWASRHRTTTRHPLRPDARLLRARCLSAPHPQGATQMSAQKGKDLLLKVDSDGAGTFTTVAGMRSRSIAFNTETVDITHAESAGRWRELLAGAGAKHAKVHGRRHLQGRRLRRAGPRLRLRRHHPRLAGRHPRLRHRRGPVPDRRLRAHRPPRRRGRLRALAGLRRRADLRRGVDPASLTPLR